MRNFVTLMYYWLRGRGHIANVVNTHGLGGTFTFVDVATRGHQSHTLIKILIKAQTVCETENFFYFYLKC